MQKFSIGQHLSRTVLLGFAAIFAVAALVPDGLTLSVRLFVLAMATTFVHIASNRVAVHEPSMGFRWGVMSPLSRTLAMIALALMVLSFGLGLFGV